MYSSLGISPEARAKLALLGDLLLGAGFNVTGIRDPQEIEEKHFLDSLSLLRLPAVKEASSLVDIGSGGGLPALVLALALPRLEVTALEAQRKKCEHIGRAATVLGLTNVKVVWARAEEFGQGPSRAKEPSRAKQARPGGGGCGRPAGEGREIPAGEGRDRYDVAVSRALASLPIVAEYSIPLLKVGGTMVAMKGQISDQEWRQAENALAILGAGKLTAVQLESFPGAQNRWVYLATKVKPTPDAYPRRVGVPTKRPLGERG